LGLHPRLPRTRDQWRYPDPALQINLDLSHASYIATANNLDPLPSPLRDRFRVIAFPKPTGEDLDALLPAVIADLAKEHGLHSRWIPPLDAIERSAAAANWLGAPPAARCRSYPARERSSCSRELSEAITMNKHAASRTAAVSVVSAASGIGAR
jgi:hypothetical protein